MIILVLIVFVLLSIITALFVLLNKLIKKSNWWCNLFVYTRQFKKDEQEDVQYDIVNVGSNPARFAFFYENIEGQNWSTGTQGLDMDFLILKEKQHLLKKGSVVLLPIVPFSSVSGFLNSSQNVTYLCKFARIMPSYYDSIFQWKKVRHFLKLPLLYYPRALKYLLHDAKCDNRLEIAEQYLQYNELNQDAQRWIKVWKDEFKITNLDGILPKHLEDGRLKSVQMMCQMVGFLIDQGFHPIIISPPMSAALSCYFTQEIRDAYINSFVKAVQKIYDIQYLDYLDSELADNSLFFNALLMNLKGRKLFTKRVLRDIGLQINGKGIN